MNEQNLESLLLELDIAVQNNFFSLHISLKLCSIRNILLSIWCIHYFLSVLQ